MPVVRISEELFREIQKYAEPLVDNFEAALWKALHSKRQPNVQIPTQQRSRTTGALTPQKDFWQPILQYLADNGGEAHVPEVIEGVRRKMKDKLKQGDFELNSDGTEKWFKAVNYQRLAMVHEGLLDKYSPRGIWKITDKGRQWLNAQVHQK